MSSPVRYRLNRIFSARSRRCVTVALDHGAYGEPSFLRGIEDLDAMLDVVVRGEPDAVQLSVGQAPLLQERPGRNKPALLLRADIANIYGTTLPTELFNIAIGHPVAHAVRLDAACIVMNLLDITGQPGVRRACTENILAVKRNCERAGMPLMVEAIVLAPDDETGGYSADRAVQRIEPLVRQAVELGADLITTDPSDEVDEFWRVVQAARVPVLARGGRRTDDVDLLTRTRAALDQGARGVMYGRNIHRHDAPAAMVAALAAMVHDDADVHGALAVLDRNR